VSAGHIRQRANGKWQALYRDPHGRQRSQTFTRRRDAESFLARTFVAKEKGEWRDPQEGKKTVAFVAAKWLSRKEHFDKVKANTLRGYRITLERHVLPTFGETQIAKVLTEDIDAWVEALSKAGVGETAIVRAFRVLGQIMKLAVLEYRMIPVSPMPLGKPKMPKPKKMRTLEPEEIDRLAAVIDPLHRTWLYAMAYTGMRWSEAAGLNKGHVDTLRRTIKVEQQRVEVAGVASVETPKTEHSIRSIPIPRWLADMLAAQLEGKSDGDPVFTTASGTHLRPADFHANTWRPALKRAGLEGVRIHDLRHTHVSMLLAQGEDPVTISERLGHHAASFTMDRYGHSSKKQHQHVADRLEVFAPTGTTGATVIPLRRPPQNP
jgi:integrase